jgi:hypothetical protein
VAGISQQPGELSRIGPVTAPVARDLARAGAADPACRWRVVVIDAEGHVVAVTRIRSPGHSPPPSAHPPGPGVLARITLTIPLSSQDESGPPTPAELATGGLNAVLRAAVNAAASRVGQANVQPADRHHVNGYRTGSRHASSQASNTWDENAQPSNTRDANTDRESATCTHEHTFPGYRIPDSLRALIEARDQDCGFPTCRRPASACDLDHTVPYDQGGLTCTCNLATGCRHHHRMKTLTSWRLRQPAPGTLIWTAPSRLTWTVTPEPHPT